MNNKTVLLGGAHIKKAIKDENFFKAFPQFKTIQIKMQAMHAQANAPKGCSTCQQRRVIGNLEKDFAAIVTALDPATAKRFKDYLQVPRLAVHAINPTTHAVYLKEL